MKKLFLISAFISYSLIGFGQCPTTPIVLTSQADVDNFTTNYPSCTQLLNVLVINGTDITDLSPLSVITKIGVTNGGGLIIFDNPLLLNLNGLQNITDVIDGDIQIQNNSQLTSISGLIGLTGILSGISIIIKDNPVLASLQGLENVTRPGNDDLHIENNDSLINLSGLNGMIGADDLLIWDNDALTSLNGLGNFESTGTITIRDNDVLVNLTGLSSLNLFFSLELKNNLVLNDISEIVNVNIDDFAVITIQNNPILSFCSISSFCEIINNGTSLFLIENNSSGCNSETEIINGCNDPIVNIPDANFKNALVNTNCVDTNGDGSGDSDADLNNDGEIQVSEAEAVLSLHVDFENINSLEGIQSFINLEWLDCNGNQLVSLNVTQNTNLEALYCGDNLLTSIDVSQNPNLESLYCYNNQLTDLDISQNPSLKILWCSTNQLMSLDITQNSILEELKCWSNQLTSIDVSQNLNLLNLTCSRNQLTSLDVSQNPNIQFLSCWENQLTSLNLKNENNINLTSMLAEQNPNLYCIQVDDVEYANNAPLWNKDEWAEYSEFCELGIEDNNNISFTLYPNPAQDVLYIESYEQIETIKIYSLQGRLVKEESSTSLVVSQLNTGLYFVQINFEGKTVTKKFIKE